MQQNEVMLISTAQNLNRQNPINVTINGTPLEQVSEYKYLGFCLDANLNFNVHVENDWVGV